MNGLGQQSVYRPFFQFLINQANSYKDGNQRAEYRNGRQPQVENDLGFVAERQLTERQRTENHDQGKKDQVVENLVANGFPIRIAGYGQDSLHYAIPIDSFGDDHRITC
jgi:hypothetical protein